MFGGLFVALLGAKFLRLFAVCAFGATDMKISDMRCLVYVHSVSPTPIFIIITVLLLFVWTVSILGVTRACGEFMMYKFACVLCMTYLCVLNAKLNTCYLYVSQWKVLVFGEKYYISKTH